MSQNDSSADPSQSWHSWKAEVQLDIRALPEHVRAVFAAKINAVNTSAEAKLIRQQVDHAIEQVERANFRKENQQQKVVSILKEVTPEPVKAERSIGT